MTNRIAADSPRPFEAFTPGLEARTPLRGRITAACRIPETEALPPLLAQARLDPAAAEAARGLALRLAEGLREHAPASGRAGLVQDLLQVFALSSQEGVALMCLAEALLRIPDAATRDALIRDKIAGGEWQAHLGKGQSLFVNAAAWGLLLTGKLVATHSEATLSSALVHLVRKGGEPLIRRGVDMAMRMMGEQFVVGETIDAALTRARDWEERGFRYSYDMLGEAALTAEDAQRYLRSYEEAIHAIGKAAAGRGVFEGPGISVKLSALHPRYSRAQQARVMEELHPRLRDLVMLARHYDIGFNIDAEEADRLELSLDLLERLCFEAGLAGWNGIGFVIQAYQKRCPYVVDHLIDLARRSGHRLMIRLVKGAYWDSEIKRAQVDGLEGYPVYTRKAYTDVAYAACASKLLAAPDAVYPQFATHNARTLATVYQMAGPSGYSPGDYEFQCLHGMGEPLYQQVVGPRAAGQLDRPCRIYAPVGTHETLLAYLVRRLLENGANTSFVHRIADRSVDLETLVRDPVELVDGLAAEEGAVGLPHPAIPLPGDLYGAARRNSRGLDLASDHVLSDLERSLRASAIEPWAAAPLLAIDASTTPAEPARPVLNPADHRDVVGHVQEATPADVDEALRRAVDFAPAWASTSPAARAAVLREAADRLEARMPQLMGVLIREAGKTCSNAVAEVREAVDFLRFYAAQCSRELDDTHTPLGPVVCISPWNFPLAIFTGQIAAALAAGNPVLAKPAEQTPLVAAEAVRTLWRAGVPRGALQLLPGRGESVGARLVADPRTAGVMFTGSTDVARSIRRTLAHRLDARGNAVTLVAETGGQNAMIVDSSALAEQVVADVVTSAFDSAGQRCSALRVLCVQEEVADRVKAMLEGAMAELRIGDPGVLATDVGPVIDAEAKAAIVKHVRAMRERGCAVFQSAVDARLDEQGTFVPPTLIGIDSPADLTREIFGPVLHFVRYEREHLASLIDRINATGYGLTLGLHTRIDETVDQVTARAHVGNVYVNRNMVGAVVGVQPFGGEGLSGTGPKAGGPLYLHRLLACPPDDVMVRAFIGDEPGDAVEHPEPSAALQALRRWANRRGDDALADIADRFARRSMSGASRALRGPTGERNLYTLLPRHAVLCLADDDRDRLVQLAAVLAVDSRAVWPSRYGPLRETLPEEVRPSIVLVRDWTVPAVAFDAVLHHGSAEALMTVCLELADRPGPIVGVQGLPPGATRVELERLVVERSLSVNTAAAGGNASLMMIG